MDNNELQAAFDILLEEIEMITNGVNEDGAAAFKKADCSKAREIIEMAARLSDFRDKVKSLQQEWASLFPPRIGPKARIRSPRRAVDRLVRGLRTPEDAFRRPILEPLVELGGSGPVSRVLEIVEGKVKSILNQYDYQPLPSNPKEPRWRNNAQWCRWTLVKKLGLVKEGVARRDLGNIGKGAGSPSSTPGVESVTSLLGGSTRNWISPPPSHYENIVFHGCAKVVWIHRRFRVINSALCRHVSPACRTDGCDAVGACL